jgi:hypothetical protein
VSRTNAKRLEGVVTLETIVDSLGRTEREPTRSFLDRTRL